MNRVEQALVRVREDLESLELPWALVGGFAVSVHAEPRLTRDVDVAIAVESDHEAERVVRELARIGCARSRLWSRRRSRAWRPLG